MLTINCFSEDKPVSVFIALLFAEEVLHIFEEKYPKDLRPREAIEAAKHWLSERTSEAANAAYAAAYAATYAADAAAVNDAAYAASNAAYAAANTAAYSYAAYAAYYAAANYAVAHNKEEFIHSILLRHLDQIIQFHIEEKQSLRNPDEVFRWLSDESKEDFIYHMDILC